MSVALSVVGGFERFHSADNAALICPTSCNSSCASSAASSEFKRVVAEVSVVLMVWGFVIESDYIA